MTPLLDPKELLFIAPEIFLTVAGLWLLVFGASTGDRFKRSFASQSMIALLGAMLLVLWVQRDLPEARVILSNLFILDRFAFFWKVLFLVSTALTVLFSESFLAGTRYRPSEFYALLMFATTGMMFMVGGYSLLSIWIALELMALSSYILVGYFKDETQSNEAALKYFLLGALSSGILLYGVSLLYGATGTVQLAEMAAALPSATAEHGILVALGWILLTCGLLFKVAAVPFHVWTPDVYLGAPTPVTGYLAAASKAASFAILLRILYQALPSLVLDWQVVLAGVAIVTMVWGNLAALTQKNVKRMLAYSSIGHAGYVLIGVLTATDDGLWAVIFYLLTYTFVTLGTFGTVILLERKEYAGETFADYAGLSQRSPFLAAVMLVFMLALTGIPPTGGFVGKIYLFAAAIEAGWLWVAIVGVLMSAVSLYYYLAVVVQMYLRERDDDTPVPLRSPGLLGAIACCALVTLLLGILPGPLIEFAKSTILPLP